MRIIATLLFLVVFLTSNAQCPPGNVILRSQAEVDAFATDYPNCTAINGLLQIGFEFDQSDITDLNSLSGINSVQHLTVRVNPQLTNLDGLSAITSVGNLILFQNAVLTDINGLSGITTITGDLRIQGNVTLPNLDGLGNLSSLGGDLWFQTSFALADISALTGLTTIGGSLKIHGGNELVAVDVFSNLTSVDGNLEVWTTSLTNLDGFSGVTSVNGTVDLYNNDDLTDISGIENIAPETITLLYLQDHAQLSNCALENICNYLSVEANATNIYGNLSGCESRDAIEAVCIVPTRNTAFLDIKLFPNPTSGMLQIDQIAPEQVIVYAHLGQVIKRFSRPGQVLDISELPAGMYYVQILAEGHTYMAKVVKE